MLQSLEWAFDNDYIAVKNILVVKKNFSGSMIYFISLILKLLPVIYLIADKPKLTKTVTSRITRKNNVKVVLINLKMNLKKKWKYRSDYYKILNMKIKGT